MSPTPPFPPRGELAAEAFIRETNHEIEAEAARYAQLHPDDVGGRVIVPFLAGAMGSRGSILLGAVVGLLTSLAALIGFYVVNAFVLDLGSHSWLHEIGLTLNAGNLWLKAGVMSGPAMGAVGAWASRRGGFVVACSVVGLVVFEPLVVYLAYLASHGRFAAGDGQWNGVYAAEAVLGAVAAAALWAGARPIRRLKPAYGRASSECRLPNVSGTPSLWLEPQTLRADVHLALATIGAESGQCILVDSTVNAYSYPN